MAGLSNIFGGDDSSDSSNGSTDASAVGSATNAVGLDYSDNNTQQSQDDDGSSQSSSSSHDLGFNSDSDSLIHSVTDAAGMSDESSN